MTWHRGFVICPSSLAADTSQLINQRAQASLLAELDGESVLAFSSRNTPKLEQLPGLVIGIEDGVAAYSIVACKGFSPAAFVVRIGLTFGLVVARDCQAMRSSKLKRLVAQLGQPSDQGEEGGLLGLRWDPEFGINDSAVDAYSKSLNDIQLVLEQAGERFRIATFEGRHGEVHGELDEVADVWGVPMVIAVVEWPGRSGVTNRVTADDSEFIVEADELADSDLS